jgi:hypothetical protein
VDKNRFISDEEDLAGLVIIRKEQIKTLVPNDDIPDTIETVIALEES